MTLEAKTGRVLGCRINLETYESATARMMAMSKARKASLVAAANTHLVSEANSDEAFGRILEGFDLVLPDGMPLVWALRMDGHVIEERVYGPYLMEHVLRHAAAGMKHYFFGGTEDCLEALRVRLMELRPDLQIVGMRSPPFGQWDVETERGLIEEINESGADFVWVALGGVKQERWIAANRGRFEKGIFLAVGDAFVLLAGLRGYAPNWMQRVGMTWLYRLAQEPKRLAGRYLKYNVRFVTAFLRERWMLVHGQQQKKGSL